MRKYTPQKLGNGCLVGTFEAGSPEWHDARTQAIGGSEIGTVLGLNPYASPYQLWAVKTGKVAPEVVNNWSVRFGKAFERPILELWQEENPEWEVMTTGTYAHVEYPWIVANPDAVARHRQTKELAVIEVKTARYSWGEVPLHYLAQTRWYMHVLGIRRGFVVAVAGWNWESHEITYDQFEEAVLIAAAKRFWGYVVNDLEPDYDGSKATYETIRQMHPDIEDLEIELGELGVGLVTAQIAFEEAEKKLNGFRSATLSAMGRAKYATVELDGIPKRRVAMRQARGNGVPWLVVKKEG